MRPAYVEQLLDPLAVYHTTQLGVLSSPNPGVPTADAKSDATHLAQPIKAKVRCLPQFGVMSRSSALHLFQDTMQQPYGRPRSAG